MIQMLGCSVITSMVANSNSSSIVNTFTEKNFPGIFPAALLAFFIFTRGIIIQTKLILIEVYNNK